MFKRFFNTFKSFDRLKDTKTSQLEFLKAVVCLQMWSSMSQLQMLVCVHLCSFGKFCELQVEMCMLVCEHGKMLFKLHVFELACMQVRRNVFEVRADEDKNPCILVL